MRAAIQNCQFDFPARRITVNLAPADLPKESGRFDLPIALGILIASGQLVVKKGATDLDQYEFAGELSLSGELRSIRGALAMCVGAGKSNRAFILPEASATEATLAGVATVLPAKTLLDVCAHLAGAQTLTAKTISPAISPDNYPDRADIKGQAQFLLYLADQIEESLEQLVNESDSCQGAFLCKVLNMYSGQLESKHQGLGDKIAETCQEVYVTIREYDVV